MDKLDSQSGKKIASAINTAILNAAQELVDQMPRDQQRDGRITAINNGVLTVEINKKIYSNVTVLRNAGELRIGDVVKCIIPNNQTSQMYAIGVADGTLNAGNDYVLPQMTDETLGGGRAITKTIETDPVAIDPTTGLLYTAPKQNVNIYDSVGTAPTVLTVGIVGQLYISTYLNKQWECTEIVDVGEGVLNYVWEELKFDSNNIKIDNLNYPTNTVQEYIKQVGSAGKFSGGAFSRVDYTHIAITEVSGMIRTSNVSNADLVAFICEATASLEVTAGNVNYIYIDYNSGTPIFATTTTETNINRNTQIPIGAVYASGISDIHIFVDGVTLNNFATKEQQRLLEVRRAERASGGDVSESGTRNIAITSGVFYSGLSRAIFPAFDSSATDTFLSVYQDGVGGYTVLDGQTQIDNLHYDNGTGTLALLTTNKYTVHWIFIMADATVYDLYGTLNGTLADAQTEQLPYNLPIFFTDFGILAAKIIIAQGDTHFNSVISGYATPFGVISPSTHNSLSGLQGGTVDQYYHLTQAQHTVAIQAATSVLNGYLSYLDYVKFDGKQDALEYTAENVANKSSDVSTDRASTTKYFNCKAIVDYVDSLVVGLLDYRGAYDASSNTYPTTGGSGTAGAVLKGDMWIISVAGTLGGVAIQVGDSIIAKVDTPAQTSTNWDTLNTNIGYIPENVTNKVTSLNALSTDIEYPSAKCVYDQLALKVDKVAGKELSTNDFTDTLKNRLDGIEAGAQVNIIETVKVNGTALTPTAKAVNVIIDAYTKSQSDSRYYIKSTWIEKTWVGLAVPNGGFIWTDGTNYYYSGGTSQYVLDKATSTWSEKTWIGLSDFYGGVIWTDGDYYYSRGIEQYVLDKATSTWIEKTWNGLTSFYGGFIWTDGDNIYYSEFLEQYVLDKATSTWIEKTWVGLTNFSGQYIWKDGDNIYYSEFLEQYVLDKATSTWIEKTWVGLTNFSGFNIWTDGINIYYSNYITQYVLDKATSTWIEKTWNGLTSFDGNFVWTDGDNIYFSDNSRQYVLGGTVATLIGIETLTNKTLTDPIIDRIKNGTNYLSVPTLSSDEVIATLSDIPSVSNFVDKTTAQTITSTKTFSGTLDSIILSSIETTNYSRLKYICDTAQFTAGVGGSAVSTTALQNSYYIYDFVNSKPKLTITSTETKMLDNAVTIEKTLTANGLVTINTGILDSLNIVNTGLTGVGDYTRMKYTGNGVAYTTGVGGSTAGIVSLRNAWYVYDYTNSKPKIIVNATTTSLLDNNVTIEKDLTLSGSLKKGAYTFTLPSSTGTLALTSQIPSVSNLLVASNIKAGTNISLSVSGNDVTINSTAGGGGTVTSVGITAGSGISVSGSPITTSGDITVNNTGVLSVNGGAGAITGIATTTQLATKAVQPYIQRSYGAGNGVRLIGTYNYSTSVGDTRPLFYLAGKQGHGNGVNYLWQGEFIFGVATTGAVTAKAILTVSDGTFGKFYYRHDTVNKILYLYIYTGQYSSAYFSDLIQINAGNYSSYFTLASAGSVTTDTIVEGVNLLYPATSGTMALTSQIPVNSSFTLADLSEKNFSSLENKPTTISGYGITDAYTETEINTALSNKFTNHSQGAYNCNTCYDEGVYLISSGSNCPSGSQYGSLFVMPYRKPTGNIKPDYCTQIYIPNGDDPTVPNSMFYRTSLANSWNNWQEVTTAANLVTTNTTQTITSTKTFDVINVSEINLLV